MSVEHISVGTRSYQLGSILGVGGFSEVRKGTDSQTRKRVALKIMFSDHLESKSELKNQLIQVQKEIKAMKQLNHPNLIRLLGYDLKGSVGGRKAIVMVQQLAPRGELFDYLMYTKKFPEETAIAIFRQLLAGLECMHSAGIAHRDLKPENLLFDNNFNLKIADFGFAYVFKKGETPKTAMRTELGTKGYMAPEIINNKKYTEKADIFAAGVILFIMLAGFPPFQNAVAKDWWFDKLMKKKYKLFWMAHERTAKFSNEAKDIIIKMLASKEVERYDIWQLKDTDFYNGKCLSKGELVEELKRRKVVVETEKAAEPQDPGRDVLSEQIFKFKDDLLPGENPLLLRDVLKNDMVDRLSQTKTKKRLKDVVLAPFDFSAGSDSEIITELHESIDEVDEAKVGDLVQNLIETSMKAKDGAEFKSKVALPNIGQVTANELFKKLRETQIGPIDDLDIAKQFAKLDETVQIKEWFPYHTKAFTYQTKLSFGFVGYCFSKFVEGRGKLEVDQNGPHFRMIFAVNKKFLFPEESGEKVVWRQGILKLMLKIKAELFYDAPTKTNLLVFTNISDDHSSMQEYSSIVTELTSNHRYVLSFYLDGMHEALDENLTDLAECEEDIAGEN